MKSLYLRIYLTVVAVLLLFAAVSGWVFQRHLEQERVRVEGLVRYLPEIQRIHAQIH